jgi:acetolactate decarboxylase
MYGRFRLPKVWVRLFSISAGVLAGCAATNAPHEAARVSASEGVGVIHPAAARLYQHTRFSTFAAGDYAGNISMTELLRHGDFGLGAADGLDGELIVLDGQAYQARAGGGARVLSGVQKTPWAAVTFFAGGWRIAVEHVAPSKALEATIDSAFPADRSLALKLTGSFRVLRLRAIPAPSKPYPPLAAAVSTQVAVDLPGTATLVGFRLPTCVKDWNLPGYHFHALTADRAHGGHVLAYEVERGEIEVTPLETFDVPPRGDGSADRDDAICPRPGAAR